MPPQVTSRHQPANMGIISYLKVGYKALYHRKLLENFDTPVVLKGWQYQESGKEEDTGE